MILSKQVNPNSRLNLTQQIFLMTSKEFVITVFKGPMAFSRSNTPSDGPRTNQSDCESQLYNKRQSLPAVPVKTDRQTIANNKNDCFASTHK